MQAIARIPHVGLSADPVATVTTNPPFKGEVITLPYMGPSLHDDTIGKPYPTEQVFMKRQADNSHVAERPEDFMDPADLFIRKIDNVARLLGCSAHEAEWMILGRM
jgi:hypothetical protein